MKLNTNSNTYTILYATIIVVLVAFLLSLAYSSLKERSDANERIDKKQQILAALNIRNIDKSEVEKKYDDVVLKDMVVDAEGNIVEEGTEKDKNGFVKDKKEFGQNCLPLYLCNVDGQTKYVLPMVGKGLWGSIWGFLALNDDLKTVFGAYFTHESETAGLGALIKEEKFQSLFAGKKAYTEENDAVLTVVKSGKVKNEETEVNGITGATLTSNGVKDMILEYLSNYRNYLSKVKVQKAD